MDPKTNIGSAESTGSILNICIDPKHYTGYTQQHRSNASNGRVISTTVWISTNIRVALIHAVFMAVNKDHQYGSGQ